ncbi:MAG: PQQ-dependent sugar dehydrogenase [Acidobacteriota bacterium]
MKFSHLICLSLYLSSNALAESTIQLVPLVSGLSSPLYVTHAGDGSERLFIVEQAGRILIFQDGTLLATPFLDINDRVISGGERGLLGLAFHPDYEENGRFFVNYTRQNDGLTTVVAEYQVSAENPDMASRQETILLEFSQPFTNHNGGMLAFGPDGYLYIGTGDGGSGGDPQGNAQNRSNLLGKILRIDVDRGLPEAGSPYAIPPDNPFMDDPASRGEIWAYGLRNPWRFSFDRAGGRLFAGDVGQSAWEEVDIILKGGNYGWNRMEGPECFADSPPCEEGLILPITSYGRSQGGSITGGYVYRGPESTGLQGVYIFGDFISGSVWSLRETGPGDWERTELLATSRHISSFGEDEAGNLYLVDHGGEVLQLQFGWRELFAHVADGMAVDDRLRSTVVVSNNQEELVSAELRLFSQAGDPQVLTIDGETDSSFAFQLEPRSSRAFTTSGTSSPLAVGWAEIKADARIAGAVIYTLAGPSGEPLAEAGIAASELAREFTTHIQRRSALGLDTALALVNPSQSDAVVVNFTVRADGQIIAQSEITLDPGEQTAIFVEEIGDLPDDLDATLFISASGDIAVTLIRTHNGVQSSSLPVAR